MRIPKMFLLLLLVAFAACSKDEEKEEKKKEDSLQLPTERTFNLSSNEHTLRISVKSTSEWDVTGGTDWCKTTVSKGTASDTLIVNVSPNLVAEPRSVSLRIANLEENKEITVSQPSADGKYQYRLPVIFHVLHNGTVNDLVVYRLPNMLSTVNKMYAAGNGNTVNMNVEFVLATSDPQGSVLKQAGINQVKHSQAKIDPESFITNKYGDVAWMWDPNKYINVIVAEFTRENTMGYSEFPYTPKANPLEGLPSEDNYYSVLPTDHFPCVIINVKSMDKVTANPDGKQNVGILTLAHELAHYLGVFHAFSGPGEFESDYCDDTPDYDRDAYLHWLDANSYTTWNEKAMRQDKNGNSFISTNIMDYEVGHLNQFTQDQRKRMRHVLTYSPLIPGPKIPVKIDPAAKSRSVQRPLMGE